MPSDPNPNGDAERHSTATDLPQQKPSSSRSESSQGPSNTLWNNENLTTILTAVVLTVVIRFFVAEARWIPSESMVPTLEIGDRLVVEKISYRFREPQRGDIVVFIPPEHVGTQDAFIKRVVGIPGDRLEIRLNEGLYVNGELLPETYTAEPPKLNGSYPEDLTVLGDLRGFPLGRGANRSDPIVVPPDRFFVMGDNRNNSQDSHIWGFLPKENIIGRTFVRFWPLNRLHYFPRVDYNSFSVSAPSDVGTSVAAGQWVPLATAEP
ncbi:signal peptidase I [Synechococcus sp. PCC 7336]|uniref:signal peptidase I n=1 Tax=Synechococcus sp. PCC 7336 TaxID=195250 RepID=UPI0003495F11|nr:signal peptidase I [Synechococcus sp. PCC 7336]